MASEDEDDILFPKEQEIIKGAASSKEGNNKHYEVAKEDTFWSSHGADGPFRRVLKRLGKGGYGAVYEVRRQEDQQVFAAKFEKVTAKKTTLLLDRKVLRSALSITSRHFCKEIDCGQVEGKYKFIVMTLIGRNLWDLRVERDSMRYTLGTALRAAAQCLVALEEMHRFGYLHRDVKPGNYAIGRPGPANEHHVIHLLDFGLARKIGDKDDPKKDIRWPRDVAPFRGTTRYAPLITMKKGEQSRKDDLESWLYMVTEWTSGALPWRKLKSDNRHEVLKMKEEIRNNADRQEEFYKHCPRREFQRILEYVDTLAYMSIPDYSFILKCLEHAMKVNNVKWEDPLDWDPTNKCTYAREEPRNGSLESTSTI